MTNVSIPHPHSPDTKDAGIGNQEYTVISPDDTNGLCTSWSFATLNESRSTDVPLLTQHYAGAVSTSFPTLLPRVGDHSAGKQLLNRSSPAAVILGDDIAIVGPPTNATDHPSSTPQTTSSFEPMSHQGATIISGSARSVSSISHASSRGTQSKRNSKSKTSSIARRSKKSDNKHTIRSKKLKASSADNRWSKRFHWPDELHRDFVAAIFDVGLKHASPSSIVEFMTPTPEVTSERVKSHLQKYRLNRWENRKDFMSNYDGALLGYRQRMQQAKEDGTTIDDSGYGLSYAEPAALLTHTAQVGREPSHEEGHSWTHEYSPSPARAMSTVSQTSDGERTEMLHLPLLTTEESDGKIGRGFGYLVGLFQVLIDQLDESRQEQQDLYPRRKSQMQLILGMVDEQFVSQDRLPRYHDDHEIFYSVKQAAKSAASMRDSDPSQVASRPSEMGPPPPHTSSGYYDRSHHYYSQQYSHGNIASTNHQHEYGSQDQGANHYPQNVNSRAPSQNQLATTSFTWEPGEDDNVFDFLMEQHSN